MPRLDEELIRFYIGEKQVIKKATIRCAEDDHDLIRAVFPDQGFITYFSGHCMKVLADQLRAADIQDFMSRQNANIEISHIIGHVNIRPKLGRSNKGTAKKKSSGDD